jgi:hypothetical protein
MGFAIRHKRAGEFAASGPTARCGSPDEFETCRSLETRGLQEATAIGGCDCDIEHVALALYG